MMTLYFCLFDACKRNGYASTPVGQFFSSGGCALIGFWVVWPFENLKNQAQAGKNWLAHARTTGLLGLYRGIVPGSASLSPERRRDDCDAEGEPAHHRSGTTRIMLNVVLVSLRIVLVERPIAPF